MRQENKIDAITLMHIAASKATPEVIKRLFDRCPDLIRKFNSENEIPIYNAIYAKKIANVKLLLDLCSEHISKDIINLRDTNTGETFLHIAAKIGCKELVEFFYDKGLSMYDWDDEGYLPIHHAAAENHHDILKWFLEKDAKLVDKKNNYNKTPILLAAEYSSIRCVILLLEEYKQHITIDCKTIVQELLDADDSYKKYFADYDSADEDFLKLISILKQSIKPEH